jgi:hypothetical protein
VFLEINSVIYFKKRQAAGETQVEREMEAHVTANFVVIIIFLMLLFVVAAAAIV